MLTPRNSILKSYRYCFYGHEFDKEPELRNAVNGYLRTQGMEIHPLVPPGEWLWPALTRAMWRSAFCIFETVTANRNVHIELGYALSRSLRVALLIREGSEKEADITKNIPSDLTGLIQIRYKTTENVQGKLESSIPQEWCSVENRLGPILRQASASDRAYFWWLLQASPNDKMQFKALITLAHQTSGTASEMSLASFLHRFDEALMIEGVPLSGEPGDEDNEWRPDLSRGAIHQQIQVNPEYRAWVAETLEMEPGKPFSA